MKKTIIAIIVALMTGTGIIKAQMPAVTLKGMDGREVRTDTLHLSNGGKPIIIIFDAVFSIFISFNISSILLKICVYRIIIAN